MKELIISPFIFFTLTSSFLHTTAFAGDSSTQIIAIEAKIDSSIVVDMQMSDSNNMKLQKLVMSPSTRAQGLYTTSEEINISTDSDLNITLKEALVLKSGTKKSENVTVSFNGKPLSTHNPQKYTLIGDNISGKLTIEANLPPDSKRGTFKGNLVLQFEEAA